MIYNDNIISNSHAIKKTFTVSVREVDVWLLSRTLCFFFCLDCKVWVHVVSETKREHLSPSVKA